MTLDVLGQDELVVVGRLRCGPLTEFEPAHEMAESSSCTPEQAADRVGGWLNEWREKGLIWDDGRRVSHVCAARLPNLARLPRQSWQDQTVTDHHPNAGPGTVATGARGPSG